MSKKILLGLLVSTIFILFSCKIDEGRIEVIFKKSNVSGIANFNITNIQFNNNQLVINGSNLSSVSRISFQNTSLNFEKFFTVESKSNNQIIANANSPITFLTSKIFDLVLSSANASATYTIDFSLCSALLGGKQIDCSITPMDNYVLSFDSASNKWKPKSISGLTYAGTHDASGGVAPTAQPSGTYYIISNAGTISSVSFNVGDWIVSNGSGYQKVANPNLVASVFGRTGAVTAQEGDYNLDKLSDVDLTVAPTNGQALVYNSGSGKWGAATISGGGGGGGPVTSSDITDGTITGVDIANDTITLAKLNGTSDSTKYLRGDKTWASFTTDVLNAPLSAYTLSSASKPVLITTDKISEAFGKIQKFLNDLNTDYVSKTITSQSITGSWSFTNPTSFLYTQTPTGATATEVTNVAYVQSFVDNAFSTGGAYAPDTLTTVSGAHTLSDTVLNVVSTSGYPTTGALLIGNEIITYSGKSGTSFTGLSRGSFGTTASAISNGVAVNNFLLMSRTTTTSSPKFVVTGEGKVGIGTFNPTVKLEVSGGQAVGAFYDAAASTTIDLNNGNMQTTSAAAGTITINNLKAGGSYTLIFTNATGGTYTLSSGGYTFRCQPECNSSQIIVNGGTHTLITIIATNNMAYVGWARGF